MKIIASISRDEYLVQATSTELARCIGYYSESSVPRNITIAVGSEISVTEAYESATAIVASSRELAEAKQKLEKTIAAIERMQSVLDPKAAAIRAKLPTS